MRAKPLCFSKKIPTTIEVMNLAGIARIWLYPPAATGTDRCAGCAPYRPPPAPPLPWWRHITKSREPLVGGIPFD
jgi:hypothetical protein